MAFITGVDVGGRILEEDDEPAPLLALPAPPRRQPKPRCNELALSDGRDIQYGSLLKDTLALHDEDELEQLRRMIKKTRGKLDNQTKVLNGFISNVNQLRGEERSFSCTDLVVAGGSRKRGSSHPALAAPPGKGRAALPPSGSAPMLKGSESALALHRPGSGNGPKAIAPLQTLQSREETRVTVMQRSTPRGLGHSRSTPLLMKVASSKPAAAPYAPPTHVDTTPLQMPARRAPPGAPGSASVTGAAGTIPGQRSAAMRRVHSSAASLAASDSVGKLPALSSMGRGGKSR